MKIPLGTQNGGWTDSGFSLSVFTGWCDLSYGWGHSLRELKEVSHSGSKLTVQLLVSSLSFKFVQMWGQKRRSELAPVLGTSGLIPVLSFLTYTLRLRHLTSEIWWLWLSILMTKARQCTLVAYVQALDLGSLVQPLPPPLLNHVLLSGLFMPHSLYLRQMNGDNNLLTSSSCEIQWADAHELHRTAPGT